MLDFTDVQDTLLDLIADRSSGDLRPALQDLLPRMVGALAAKSSTLRVKFLTAPAKHGKTLVSHLFLQCNVHKNSLTNKACELALATADRESTSQPGGKAQ